MRQYRKVSIDELIEENRKDPRYDTDMDTYTVDGLTVQEYLGGEGILPMVTPGSGRQFPGVVGYFDCSEMLNEGTPNGWTTAFISDNHREHYHPSGPAFIDPVQNIEEWFTIRSHSAASRRLPRTSWPHDADAPREDSAYWSRDLHTPDWAREATTDPIDPTDVHDRQAGLTAFEDATQADVNPDALDPEDARLEDLPAFIDAAERDDCLNKYDPAKNSVKSQCDHCGGEDPWLVPLERGVRSVRDGGITEGNPDYDHCEPEDGDIESCACCRCPTCGGQSISHRKTRSPSYRCNTCKLEFEHPIEFPSEEGERARLYWRCKHCRKPTMAPFPGIPTALLDD
ncbi:hypothetical protein [Natronomonas marina]|uniref:hypothetical protein n=1 Tax=Natronomonas marina TaxID=2961939 RepID=UPI0020C9F917|nr:hypothetical protein [Natronomonas marina]